MDVECTRRRCTFVAPLDSGRLRLLLARGEQVSMLSEQPRSLVRDVVDDALKRWPDHAGEQLQLLQLAHDAVVSPYVLLGLVLLAFHWLAALVGQEWIWRRDDDDFQQGDVALPRPLHFRGSRALHLAVVSFQGRFCTFYAGRHAYVDRTRSTRHVLSGNPFPRRFQIERFPERSAKTL